MPQMLKILLLVMSVSLITACGLEEDAPAQTTTEDESTNNDTTDTATTSDPENVTNISIGVGTGAAFDSGSLSVSGGSTDLTAFEPVTISVNLVDTTNNNELYSGSPIAVTFESGCVANGDASFSRETVYTSSGVVTTTYTPSTCLGADTIIASHESVTASVQVNVLEAEAESMSFSNDKFAQVIAIGDVDLDGNPSSSTVAFLIVDPAGNPLQGKTVDFSLSDGSAGYATLSQNSATSNAYGMVSTVVNAGRGGQSVQVEASHQRADTTVITAFSDVISVVPGELGLGTGSDATFTSGSIDASAGVLSDLAAGGTTTLTFNIVETSNSNVLYLGENTEVTLGSECAAEGRSAFSDATPVTSSGQFSVDYTANGCVGTDRVTAQYGDAVAEVDLTIAPSDIAGIAFDSISETSIAYSDSGTVLKPNYSTVSFSLYDANGIRVEGQNVDFSVASDDPNNGVGLSSTSETSDIEGQVSTVVMAGSAAASVRVLATYTAASGKVISTQSPPIAVNTGLPDSQSFSLSVKGASVAEAGVLDGVTTQLTVHVADRQNNPVVDGTVVSFWTEYGQVEPTCTTSNGACSATWESGGVRPLDGKSTVVAYTAGEDSFIESGPINGIYNVAGDSAGLSADETIISSPEMYFDLNYDGYTAGSYTDAGSDAAGVPGDGFVDDNGNGIFDPSSALFRGAYCSTAALAAGHCAQNSIQVWDHSQLVLATREANAVISTGPWTVSATPYTVDVTDSNGNYPPVGTTVTIAPVGAADASVEVVGVVPSVGEADSSPYQFEVYVNEVVTQGDHRITVTLPGGIGTSYSRTIN